MLIPIISFILLCLPYLINPQTIIVFVNPSTVLGINGEKYFPAIQNIKLPGFFPISKISLLDSCYQEVFLPFITNYKDEFSDKTAFYMYNWSGTIYPCVYKLIASKELFIELSRYKKNHPNDIIWLIGCSHGGSVILGMAELLMSHNIQIDMIILLGTPISEQNNENALKKINNKKYVFKHIINIYSKSDFIQIADIFFNNFSLCKRTISERSGLINYLIKDFGHIELWHKTSSRNPFIVNVPMIIKEVFPEF
jgi:hypothetical protein